MLSLQEKATSFRLLEPVFPEGSDAELAYNSIPHERDTIGFSLSNPLPEVYRKDVFSYAEVFHGEYQKYLLEQQLDVASRADAAGVLAEAMSKYDAFIPEEEAAEIIGQGMTLFEQITGFDVSVSESDLEELLPTSPFPRKVGLIFFLLELRNDILNRIKTGGSKIVYGISNFDGNRNETKNLLLRYGLALANFALQTDQPGFSIGEMVVAFKALTGYDIGRELQSGNVQI